VGREKERKRELEGKGVRGDGESEKELKGELVGEGE